MITREDVLFKAKEGEIVVVIPETEDYFSLFDFAKWVVPMAKKVLDDHTLPFSAKDGNRSYEIIIADPARLLKDKNYLNSFIEQSGKHGNVVAFTESMDAVIAFS